MSLIQTLKFITDHPLNNRHKFQSLIRFAKWQISSRMMQGEFVYPWIGDAKFFVKKGDFGLTGNIYTGLHEFSDMGFLLHFLRKRDLFVDVGANLGSYSILACAVVGAQGIAFEPVPNTFERLHRNMRLNSLEQTLTCVNKGVGAAEGFIKFSTDEDTTNHALANGEHSKASVDVEIVALDSALRGSSPILIKIDVEGYESKVLEGAQEVLANASLRAVIMELNGSGFRYGFDESKILAMVNDLGFKPFSYNPSDRSLIPIDGKNAASGNTLFIRDESFVKDRIKQAPRVIVNKYCI